jgi:hypothetical protein
MSSIADLKAQIILEVHRVLDADYTAETHDKLKRLSSELEACRAAIDDLKAACDKQCGLIAADLTSIIADQPAAIYHTQHGMLMYPSRDTKLPVYHAQMTPAGLPLTTPTVADLQDIPPALYWHADSNASGWYMRVGSAIVQVPWPAVYHGAPHPPPNRCHHLQRATCERHRREASAKYKTPQKKCYYAHQGDRLPRIVHPSRCPSSPDFGQPGASMPDTPSIKALLLHGLHDIASAALAIEHTKKSPVVLRDLTTV